MDESEPLLPKRSETSNRRAVPHIVNIELKYDSIEQVKSKSFQHGVTKNMCHVPLCLQNSPKKYLSDQPASALLARQNFVGYFPNFRKKPNISGIK